MPSEPEAIFPRSFELRRRTAPDPVSAIAKFSALILSTPPTSPKTEAFQSPDRVNESPAAWPAAGMSAADNNAAESAKALSGLETKSFFTIRPPRILDYRAEF